MMNERYISRHITTRCNVSCIYFNPVFPYSLLAKSTSPPKVIWEENVAVPHGRDWTGPLHAHYPLQTNPITQLWVRATFRPTRQCHMRPIRYTALAVLFPLLEKKFAPCLTGDIHEVFIEPDYIFEKPMKRRFQRYLVRTEILSTFHVRVEYISVRKIRHSAHSNHWRRTCLKIPKSALSFGAREPPSNT